MPGLSTYGSGWRTRWRTLVLKPGGGTVDLAHMPAKTTRADGRPGERSTSTGTRLARERRAVVRLGDGAVEAVGSDPAQPIPVDVVDPAIEVEVELELELEVEEGETTLFEAAITAFHAGEFIRAESLFLEEASRALDTAPQRAAIAYRQAALAARSAGNLDGSDHWMRLAGREYLRVSEDIHTPVPFIREAALMAARCFLSVENLHIASKGLRRAQAIESVLRADDDLLAGSAEIPFRHETASPVTVVEGEDSGTAAEDDWVAPDCQGEGWLHRLRQRLPNRSVA